MLDSELVVTLWVCVVPAVSLIEVMAAEDD